MKSLKVLIVEDEIIIARDLAYHLKTMGLEVCGILVEGEKVLDFLQTNTPDMILMDISLRGKMDGISVVHQIQKKYTLPIIYLTANTDDITFQLAKVTKPFAFIEKPFKKRDLLRTLELLIERLIEKTEKVSFPMVPSYVLKDRIFIKDGNALVKVFLQDILYVQAERAYCLIATQEKKFLLSVPLKNFEEQITTEFFLRVHRSYLINLNHIDSLEDNTILIQNVRIPVSRSYQEILAKHLRIF
jgi:DNA-binding LytR/AlgR family response regulator